MKYVPIKYFKDFVVKSSIEFVFRTFLKATVMLLGNASFNHDILLFC